MILCKFEHDDYELTINRQSSLSRDFRTCTFSIESSTRVIYLIFVVTYPNMNDIQSKICCQGSRDESMHKI